MAQSGSYDVHPSTDGNIPLLQTILLIADTASYPNQLRNKLQVLSCLDVTVVNWEAVKIQEG